MGGAATALLVIVVDASVWIDHARRPLPPLDATLDAGQAYIHEFVVGELLLGSPADRQAYGRFLDSIPRVVSVTSDFLRAVIEEGHLYGAGIGYVDAHLVASTVLIGDAKLWTRDRRLGAVAERLGIRAELE